MLLKINPYNPQERQVDKAVEILKKGGLIAYPTDTYYGIGCDLMNKKAIEKIYSIKKKKIDKKKPFSFICSSLKNISDYAKVSNYAYKTMKRLLPGAYTFILEGSRLVPKIMLTKRKEAGIRVPNHSICIQIVEKLGNPIINATATDTKDNPLRDASFIYDFYSDQIDCIIDGGPVNGEPSSVISLINDEPEILREGSGDISIFE